MQITRKIIASLVMLVMAVAVVSPVSGQTVEELQAQIQELLALVQQLQNQLDKVQNGTGASASCNFTRNLFVGSTGEDVRCLQQYLNSNGFLVSQTGAGSPGHETTYYGPKTKQAVANWQASNNVSPAAGYFGPLSRAKYSTLIAAQSQQGQQGGAEQQQGGAEQQQGGAEQQQGGAEQQQSGSDITTPGAEGSISAKYAASPASGEQIFADTTGVNITGVEVKATGSDVKITRMDIEFTSRPWLYVKKLTISDGSTVVKTVDVTEANTIEQSVGSKYWVRVEGVNVVVPKGTTKTFNILIDPILPAGSSTATLSYNIPSQGIRGVDGASIQQYAGGLDSRTVTIKVSDTASLEISANTDNPELDRNVVLNENSTTNGILALVFNVKAKNNSAVIREISASSTYPTNSVLKLYDGNTLLKNVAQGSSVTFDELNISVAKDSTKTLTIKVDVPKQASLDGTVSASSSLTANSSAVVAEDANSYVNANVTGSNINSGVAKFYKAAPALALDSASIQRVTPSTNSNTQWADFTIKVKVTAQGGDVYMAPSTSMAFTATTSEVASSTVTGLTVTSEVTEDSNGSYLVPNGSTKLFTVTGRIENTAKQSYSVYALISAVRWGETSSNSAQYSQTSGLNLLKTSPVIIDAKN